MKQVYEFKEGGKEMIPILGGKGGNLSEMDKDRFFLYLMEL